MTKLQYKSACVPTSSNVTPDSNHSNSSQSTKVIALTKSAIVVALYVTITIALAPISYGVIQCRLSEMLNFLALHNKRYIISITVACAIANIFSFGPIDMVVGSLASFVFLWIGRIICNKIQNHIVKYATFAVIFSVGMFPIAIELKAMYNMPFFATWLSLGLGELVSLVLGGVVMTALGKFIDFSK
ncbi:MAG: QueT transporter family protein [Clostridiales Family XIII bacterium]|jgi:uncharacterized membrane protein|nr:QueT transporter family protein [Clostridiales Family XIII bacterium]